MLNSLHTSKKSCNFASKIAKDTTMEAALRQNYQERKYHSLNEFADKSAKKLSQHNGMNDIRERERLIDPDWKEQPMRPWSEVYADLCREVGHAYGLNDIQEA
jgi:hypothetical protein